jgi:hypothetical protein
MKPLFIISCPIDTYSGYGARSRDVVKAIINSDKYEVKVLPQRWGNCPWGFIDDHPKKWGFLTPHLLPIGNQLPKQPDIWAQITVPNEFQAVGKYNIGFTAGIETTICSPQWIDGINRMDLNLVSSEHSKQVFLNSTFEQREQNTNKLIKTIKVEKPIEVLFEGVDLDTYFPTKSTFNLDEIEEDFAYLFMGHWMQGALGEDRKNVGLVVKTFYEAFKNKKKTPSLILKTSTAGTSYLGREQILDKIHQIRSTMGDARTLPNIYLLHGEFSDEEINQLYNHKKIKAMVSLTKGEGYGRPLAEFSLTKKPIISTNWSGHLDFLNPKFTTLIKGELKNIHPSAVQKDVILAESQWFSPNTGETAYYLREIFENYKFYKENGVRQAHQIKSKFSFNHMSALLDNILTNSVPEFPKQIELKLPELKLPNLKKQKFPNLEPSNA